MPRSRRRRANDRRRDADQRRIASEALQRSMAEKDGLERFVRAVYRNRVGEVIEGPNGSKYLVLTDGSLDPV